jgi:hypothetical protein
LTYSLAKLGVTPANNGGESMTQPNSSKSPPFGIEEIKYVLKSKADCLKAGLPSNDMIIRTLDDIRNQYIRVVGLSDYLSQMLGELGQVPIQYCTLYHEDGTRIEPTPVNDQHLPIHRFIADQFQREHLPFKIEVYFETGLRPVEICYL